MPFSPESTDFILLKSSHYLESKSAKFKTDSNALVCGIVMIFSWLETDFQYVYTLVSSVIDIVRIVNK